MISHGKKCHYLAAKSFSALLRGITLKHYVEMPEKDNKILKKNHGENSMKVLFIIYADLEYLLKKMHSCYNNPEESSKSQNIYAYTFWLLVVYKLFIWKKN